jgi:hypothetical protein
VVISGLKWPLSPPWHHRPGNSRTAACHLSPRFGAVILSGAYRQYNGHPVALDWLGRGDLASLSAVHDFMGVKLLTEAVI